VFQDLVAQSDALGRLIIRFFGWRSNGFDCALVFIYLEFWSVFNAHDVPIITGYNGSTNC